MANNSNLSKRAALRKQQELEEQRKRAKKMMVIGLSVVSVIALVIVSVVFYQWWSRSQASQETPPNATQEAGITINSTGTKPEGTVPHVVAYEDYQCPGCAAYEKSYGEAFLKLIDEGKITFEVRTAHFLNDVNRNGNQKSSSRAAMAAAAADQVGKYREYHAAVFKNQPQEGVGYTDEQLTGDFAEQAGITGEDLATFKKLYEQKTYEGFIERSNKAMGEAGVTSTPTYRVNGKDLKFVDPQTQKPIVTPNNPDSLMSAIQQTADSGS